MDKHIASQLNNKNLHQYRMNTISLKKTQQLLFLEKIKKEYFFLSIYSLFNRLSIKSFLYSFFFSIFLTTITSYSQIPKTNLSLWLKADSLPTLVLNGSSVSAWKDCSGNGNDVIQSDINSQPTYLTNTLNGHPVIKFDGTTDYLRNTTFSQTQPLTVFVVWHVNSTNGGTVFDGVNSRILLRYFNNMQAYAGASLIYNKSIPFTNLSTIEYNSSNSAIYENGVLMNSGDLGTNILDGLVIGSVVSNDGLFLDGYIAEIIMYNTVLTNNERIAIETYLSKKYAETINPSSNVIIKNSLCDTTIHAGAGYSSYLWNSGATTESITVGKGTYSVLLSNPNEFPKQKISSVSYKDANLVYDNKFICSNSSKYLKTGLKSPEYTIHWNTGYNGDSLKIINSGSYWATITDKNACATSTDTVAIIMDTLPLFSQVLLGNDTNLCSGNTLNPTNKSLPTGLTYKWSTNETTAQIQITTSGTYTLTVTDANNCVANDAMFVTVSGTAPNPYFSMSSGCVGDVIQFTNSSIPVGDSWLWTFGDGNNSTIQNPTHGYTDPNKFNVTLKVSSGNCKNTITKQIDIPTKPDIPLLLYPLNNFYFHDSIRTFLWNKSINTDYYIFELATKADFSTLVYASDSLKDNKMSYLITTKYNTLYWRVSSFNKCGKQTSATHILHSFLGSTILKRQLWLRADSNVVLSGSNVLAWKDCSGNGNDVTQSDVNSQPTYLTNTLNGLPVIKFDGINDYLRNTTFVQNQPLTVFVVWHVNSTNGGTVFDGVNSRILLRYYNDIQAYAGTSSTYSKSVPFTNLSTVVFNGTNSAIYDNGILQTTGDFGANILDGLTIGTSYLNDGLFLDGYIAEIIMYNSVLSNDERIANETYLSKKYAEPIKPSLNVIVKNALCDTTIHAGVGYSTYLWNTGATTESITVGKGTYSVILSNTNEFPKQESISVSYKGANLVYDNKYICSYSSKYIKTGLKSPGYSLHWNTGYNGDSLKINTAGYYWARITDKNSCATSTDSISFLIDTLPSFSQALLGTDTNLCSGNTLNPTNKSLPTGLTYKWSTNETTAQIQITTSDTYTLTVTDANNCVANDAMFVTVSGTAPNPYFSMSSGCVGDVIQFTNSSIPVGDSWLWTFGDGSVSTIQNPKYSFTNSGIYNTRLKVTSGNCQNTITKQVTVPQKPARPLLLFPENNGFIVDSVVTFQWKSSSMSNYSVFELANDVNFTTLLFTSNPLLVDSFQYHILSNQKVLYWRIHSFNSCGSQSSTTNKINLFYATTSMKLWVMADKNVLSNNGSISNWNDCSGNGNNLYQPIITSQPTLVKNKLNGHPVIQFDGINDYLLDSSFLQSQPITIFIIWSLNAVAALNNSVFDGNMKSRIYFRYNNNNIEIGDMTMFSDYFHASPPFTTLTSIVLNKGSFSIFENGILKNSGINGTNDLNGLVLGINADLYQIPLKGSIAEMIIYKSTLNAVDRKTVEDYLHKKYTPTLELGPDISITQSLCDTIIHAGKGFKSYLWSTGDTTEAIRVKRSGKYLVDVMDEFGYTSSDDINVKFAIEPGIIKDSTICPGASFIWDTKLLATDFSFKWSTGATTPAITIATAGNYTVTISDKGGCSYKSDTATISIDDFNKSIDLGKDTTFCQFNEIGLKKGANRCKSYLWNDGSTNMALQVLSSGTYYVTATDIFGCSANDSVKIMISGTAPDTKFTFTGHCEHDTISLNDNSVSRDGKSINAYKWFIGNDTLQGKTTNYAFTYPGSFFITLKTYTVSCTGEMTLPIVIDPKPKVSFKPSSVCQYTINTFKNTSTLTSGSIKNVQWIFDDSLIQNKDTITRSFTNEGFNHAKLIITTDKNCVDSSITPIEVKSTPKATIGNTATCERNAYYLFDKSTVPTSNSIIERTWYEWAIQSFLPVSYSQTVQFKPDSTRSYSLVKLEVKGVNGCIDSVIKKIIYNPIPKAAMQIQNSCVDDIATFYDKSTITNGSIAEWKWDIGDSIVSFEQNPKIIFKSSKTYPVSLRITSDMGCEDTIVSSIKTIKKPKAHFDFEPKIVGAPIDISFSNSSDSASSFLWNFGDTYTSTEFEPVHEYADSGNYEITLHAYNDYFCADSVKQHFMLARSNYKIVQTSILTTDKNGYVAISTIFINAGLNPLTSIDFILTKDDGTWVKETWKGMVTTGVVDTFTFASHFREMDGALPKYICIDANVLDKHDSIVATSNKCLTQTKELTSFTIYPNPADDKLTITFATGIKGMVSYSIFDNIGKPTIQGTKEVEEGYNTITIPTDYLAQGYYIWKIEVGGKSKTGAFIINRK